MDNGPQYPLYIPSKGRYEYMMTSKALTLMGIHHHIVVEPQEVEAYQKAVDELGLLTTVIELDMKYKETYEYCDDYGTTKSTGSGPARNFIWDHSMKSGYSYHWIMDDNIRSFRRLNKNEKVKVSNGAIFKAMEDFMLRYENIGMGGPNYLMFAPARAKQPPFVLNTRIYSCNFIMNDIPFRWRGRYNEDTILSLDMLKRGWCTVLFNAFLQEKMVTQHMKGGNTDTVYKNGTVPKSKMLVDVHPDVSKLKFRFHRWHHIVDYTPFKLNKLVRKKEVDFDSLASNEYGMELKTI